MNEFKHRIVAVINKSIDSGKAMNALAHIAIGLGGRLNPELLELMDYNDANGNSYPNISKMPFVILQANSNKIKNLYQQTTNTDIKSVAFTDAMTVGTWQEQLIKSQQTNADDLIYYAIVLFGDAHIITELTRKFSLWK